jgi:predicted RNase H-like HicB family nuclease
MRYLVIMRRTDTGYSVDVPDLPGCVAAAGTLAHAKRLIAEAIWLHVDLMRRSGETIPRPTKRIRFEIDEETEEEIYTWVEAKRPKLARARTNR